ncbi:MAG TPA: nuclear transport factor 2 family protein [Pseudonocardia sp.]|jgi:hypothetical protein|nr:nuclear transport factor 2 family protein [Pseudonocardia sp.]
MSAASRSEFAQHWLAAWNNHDVEAVLGHFTDDVVFRSPAAVRLLSDSDGVIRGKDELRRYWTLALEKIPDLRFELLGGGNPHLRLSHRGQARSTRWARCAIRPPASTDSTWRWERLWRSR